MLYAAESFECTPLYRVTDAVVTTEKVTIDWEENGESGYAEAISSDGHVYSGNYGYEKRLEPGRRITFTLFKAPNDELVLLGRWWNMHSGYEGQWLIHLVPQKNS